MICRKVMQCLAILMILAGCSKTGPLPGYWTGTMNLNGKTVDLELTVDSGQGFITSRDLAIFEQPAADLGMVNDSVSFTTGHEPLIRFNGVIAGDSMRGTAVIVLAKAESNAVFGMKKMSGNPPEKNYTTVKITVRCKGVKLASRVYKPNTPGRHPAMILLHGPSPDFGEDYAFYADYFATRGFEVLVYDNRGNGESTGNYPSAGYDDLADDAIACMGYLRSRESVDKHKVGIIGFSQGATLIPYIMSRVKFPVFAIAVSPEVDNMAQAGAFADSLKVVRTGHPVEDGHIVAETHRKVAVMIAKGDDSLKVSDFIRSNAEKYPFMDMTGLPGNIRIISDEFGGYSWKGRAMDFLSYWKDMTVKTLILFGEEDEMINVRKNAALITGLNKQNITVRTFVRAGHALKKSSGPGEPSDIDWPRLADGYLDYMGKWVAEQIHGR